MLGAEPVRPRRWAVSAFRGVGAIALWWRPGRPTPPALAAMSSDRSVEVDVTRDAVIFEPRAGARCGLVLYPGARVDPRAYSVLGRAVAANGFRVVVPTCTMNLAWFSPRAADRYVDGAMPWAVGGHSLGGVVAARYAARHPSVRGLVLWAGYGLDDLSGRDDLAVASVWATRDGVTLPHHIDKRRHLLPAGTVYTEIPGGIHGYFGDYGTQPGDGEPAVDRRSAQQRIVEATVALLEQIAGAPPPGPAVADR